jgi:NAD(P)-dependent dehydrogenase (short-subunit alcohol dehydrogenase family)
MSTWLITGCSTGLGRHLAEAVLERGHNAVVTARDAGKVHGARISPPGSGYYSASKPALEGMSASLRKEVGPLGITVLVVEPGGFRTDLAGRSLQQSPHAIPDYADTAGLRRKENDTAHGNQPGEPARAAQAIITAVQASESPFLLLLGADALKGFDAVADAQRKERQAWESLTLSTSFPA